MVAGIQEQFSCNNEDFDTIWMKKFMTYHDKICTYSKDKAYYGIWFETDEFDRRDYLAGMSVENIKEMPDEIVIRSVPEARYLVFECKVKNIGETWDLIFAEWLPKSKYKKNTIAAGFEYYPPDTKDQESPVYLYLPVIDNG